MLTDRLISLTSYNNNNDNNIIKAKIDKTQIDSKCRMCGKADESINHILSECSKLVQKEYKRRHDWVGKRVLV